jgi:hypothetical protein
MAFYTPEFALDWCDGIEQKYEMWLLHIEFFVIEQHAKMT